MSLVVPSRRAFLVGAAAALASGTALSPLSALAANTSGIRFGASRWDAWYDNVAGLDSWYAQHNLDPAQYQARAPWFATQVGPNQMSINGNFQSVMDAEINYASAAGLKFWAFLYYGNTGGDADFSNAFYLYQSSSINNKINWCWIHNYVSLNAMNTAGSFATLIAQMGQSNYEPGLTNRPMLMLLPNGSGLASSVTTAIANLRSACSSAGLGNPYIVLLSRTASDVATAGADALGDYAYSGASTTYGTYASLSSVSQADWNTRKAAGQPFIPCLMTGWDRRPRIERPVPWEVAAQGQLPYQGMSNSFQKATPAELASLAQACIAWMQANSSAVPSMRAMFYSWNEYDEGGWLCPTWTANGPDNSRLTALTGVL